MGSLGRKRRTGTGTGGSGWSGNQGGGTSNPNTHPTPRAGTEYEDDNVTRLPVSDSLSAIRSAQRLARTLQQRSGRGSTRLVTQAGIVPYSASLMGSTQ